MPFDAEFDENNELVYWSILKSFAFGIWLILNSSPFLNDSSDSLYFNAADEYSSFTFILISCSVNGFKPGCGSFGKY